MFEEGDFIRFGPKDDKHDNRMFAIPIDNFGLVTVNIFVRICGVRLIEMSIFYSVSFFSKILTMVLDANNHKPTFVWVEANIAFLFRAPPHSPAPKPIHDKLIRLNLAVLVWCRKTP